MRRSLGFFIAALAVAFASAPTQAANSTGRVKSYYLSGGNNLGFRVILESETPGCSIVYINTSDDNYAAKVAGLLTAFSMGRLITLYYTINTSTYCPVYDYQVY